MIKKEIIISSLGNTVEWFDFGLFIFMAPLIGATFFPQQSEAITTLEALIVFAAGFLCRPLGGIFFGYFGDRRGRAKTLRMTLLLITLSTVLIGLMPSYEQIGIVAPISFVALRLIQGLSIGGEYSGVMIYLAESGPPKKRGFITSFAATGANLGFLLATFVLILLNLCCSKELIKDWAWRIPFLLIGIPGSLMIYYRFKLSETRVYMQLQEHHHITLSPLITAIKYAPYQLLKIIGLTCMGGTFYYVFIGYMPTYLEFYLGFSAKEALTIQSGLLISMLFLVPLAGICGDYFSRKKMILIIATAVMILVLPCFYLLQTHSLLLLLLALGTTTVLSAFEQGNTLAAVVENCPENIRYTGIAFSYNLGNALFAGTTPLIVTLLTQHISLIAPAYYLIFMAMITLITAITLLKNNQHLGPIYLGAG